MLTPLRLLPVLPLLALCACSGHVQNGDSGDDGSPGRSGRSSRTDSSGGNEPVIVGSDGGYSDGDGDSAGEGAGVAGGSAGGAATESPPGRPEGTGGAPLTPINIDLWCPMGDEWDLLFEGASENLGGAPGASECPRLPSTSYGESYCVTTFASVEPIALNDSGTCCYQVEMIYCR